jgi:dCMP deaminase
LIVRSGRIIKHKLKHKNMEEVKEKFVRPSWDEYFLGLLDPLSKRSTCDRGRRAAVITSKNNTILATGYAGAPPGMPHCDEVGHLIKTIIHEDGTQSQHCMRTLHAEENAILQCAKDGIRLEGATVYVTATPCYNCAMRIARVGIKRVVARKRYQTDKQSVNLFKVCGIELVVLDNTIEEYKNQ